MKHLHFLIGLATVVHFAVTGWMMRTNFFKIEQADELVRMMLRANHIYILFAGLLNLAVSFVYRYGGSRAVFAKVCSGILLISTIGLNLAFYTDPITHSLERSLTRFSVFGCFAGTVLLLVYMLFSKVSASR